MNPPEARSIDYWLGQGRAWAGNAQMYNFTGKLVRRFASDETPTHAQAFRYFDEEWLRPADKLSGRPAACTASCGTFAMRVRRRSHTITTSPRCYREDTPTSVEGPFVLPGI